MSDYLAADGTFINSIVGEGTKFRGELDLDGLLRIDGDYTGTIKTTGKVLVGKNGRAQCTIKAGTVVIGGVVKGNIVSTEKVIILSSGILIGNVTSPRLIVEEGVVLDGSCLINQNEFNPEMDFPEESKPAEEILNVQNIEIPQRTTSIYEPQPSLVDLTKPAADSRFENKEYTVWKG